MLLDLTILERDFFSDPKIQIVTGACDTYGETHRCGVKEQRINPRLDDNRLAPKDIYDHLRIKPLSQMSWKSYLT